VEQEPIRPLLRAEYDFLVDAGLLEGEPVELLEGRLVLVSPEGPQHASTQMRLTRLLTLALGERAWVRTGNPLAASEVSEPEPDVAVIDPGDYDSMHPATARLVVEISSSSIRKDRLVKPTIYAAAGIPEYWIVDLPADSVTVLRDPRAGGYATAQSYGRGTCIALLAFPDVVLEVDAFLPPPA
jgi:Uma2 family endonuclease